MHEQQEQFLELSFSDQKFQKFPSKLSGSYLLGAGHHWLDEQKCLAHTTAGSSNALQHTAGSLLHISSSN